MTSPRPRRSTIAATLFAFAALPAHAVGADDSAGGAARFIDVRTPEELVRAARAARAGDRIRIAPGIYEGGIHLTDLRGEKGKPVVLEAKDADRPPLFRGGTTGLHLTDPAHVEIHDLAFAGQTGNGVNVDDGGSFATPAHDVVLSGLSVKDVGPDGNHDGIKLSGVVHFRVERCTVERWGLDGSAVDMVGCRGGTIESCVFRHSEAARGSGAQAKGGTRDVAVRRCRFEDAGSRAVNVGGSTGLAFFRPPLPEWTGPRFEAKDVRVEGNTFVGGETPVAFVGADGCVFRFNTVHHPRRWALRILQENVAAGFVPSRNGRVTDNVFVFRSDSWREGGVNRGPGTEPASFVFERNIWYCTDAPSRTRDLVRLPAPESGGTYGEDPLFVDAAAGDFRLRPKSPAAKAGADAFRD